MHWYVARFARKITQKICFAVRQAFVEAVPALNMERTRGNFRFIHNFRLETKHTESKHRQTKNKTDYERKCSRASLLFVTLGTDRILSIFSQLFFWEEQLAPDKKTSSNFAVLSQEKIDDLRTASRPLRQPCSSVFCRLQIWDWNFFWTRDIPFTFNLKD